PARHLHEPVTAPGTASLLDLMEQLRRAPVAMALLVDEFGTVEGIATSDDILRAIAGFSGDGAAAPRCEREGETTWLVDGRLDLREFERRLEVTLEADHLHHATVAGFLLGRFGHLPKAGDSVAVDGLAFEVVEVQARRITRVRVRRLTADVAASV
ncbi:MAG TPA: transporter associated domain-containing protein, partial [Vineibacter sp.]|nr:transporter associated domain-containing protein [Vineibacter sp.]